jgi:serine/threonine protein kinase
LLFSLCFLKLTYFFWRSLAEDADPSIPTILQAKEILARHRLRVNRRLGRGVYEVSDTENQVSAAKICLLNEEDSIGIHALASRRGQMENEIALLSGPLFGCPGIPTVVRVYRDHGHLVTLLRPVGRSPSEVTDGGENLQAFGLVLRGTLREIHRRGVIHRDVKPANVVVDASNKPILIDFGFAIRANERLSLANTNVKVGTQAYGSDNFHDNRPLTAEDDFQCLGFTLHALKIGVSLWLSLVVAEKKPRFKQMCASDTVAAEVCMEAAAPPFTVSTWCQTCGAAAIAVLVLGLLLKKGSTSTK